MTTTHSAFTKLTAFALSVWFLLTVAATNVNAATASPSASPQSTPSSDTTTQNLKDRIEKIVQEKREQIKGALEKLGQKSRASVGEVQRVTEDSLTIRTTKGVQIIPLTKDVELLEKGKAVKIGDIEVGNWAVVMGVVEEDDSFVPLRILISATTLRPRTHKVTIGTLSEITKTTAITVRSRAANSEAVTATLTKSTSYQNTAGESITLKDLKTDLPVLLITYTDDKDVVTATVVRSLSTLKSSDDEE